MRKQKQAGFTIVELLIVIVVIGILAALVLNSFSSAQAKARDTKRVWDMKAIEKALEVNYTYRGAYTQPESLCTDSSYGGMGSCGSTITGNWEPNSDLRDVITDGGLRELPLDPINNATYKYTYEVYNAGEYGLPSAGQGYSLCAALEKGGNYCIDKRK